jgi:hypothetical protein
MIKQIRRTHRLDQRANKSHVTLYTRALLVNQLQSRVDELVLDLCIALLTPNDIRELRI